MEFSDNSEMVRYITELCNQGKVAECFSYYHEDYHAHRPTGEQHGRTASEEGIANIVSAMPDQHTEILEIFGEGEKLAVRWALEGTHTGGELMGVPATGRKARLVVNQIMIIRDGLIVEGWEEFDRLDFMEQLGATIEVK